MTKLLRNQSQQRINEAFDLTNGWNNNAKIHSPTFRSDFNDTNMDYMGTFQMRRIKDGEDVTNIVVIKKANHLPNLISQINKRNVRFSSMSNILPSMCADRTRFAV